LTKGSVDRAKEEAKKLWLMRWIRFVVNNGSKVVLKLSRGSKKITSSVVLIKDTHGLL
jgi:hypothetical protein